MASEDKKISSLTKWLYADIQDAADMVVAHLGDNYRIALSTLKQYVLGGREIGGVAAGSVVTNNATQALSNKALVNPDINGTIVSVTGRNINHLHGLNENVQSAIDNLTHDMLAAESKIDAVEETVDALQADKIYSTVIGAPSGDTSIKIEASSMSNDDIDPYSLSISVYEAPGGGVMKLLNLSNIDIVIANNILSSIVIADVVPMNTYRIVIRYRLVEE